MNILIYFRDWFNPSDIEDASTLAYEGGRRTVHSPALKPSHFHNFLYKTPCPENFPYLSIPGIKSIISCMTDGLPEDHKLGSNRRRDHMVMEAFLAKNSASKVIQLDMRPADKMLPGTVLLDSLVVDSLDSRWSLPSKQYLSRLRNYRSVDNHSLEQVDYLSFTGHLSQPLKFKLVLLCLKIKL